MKRFFISDTHFGHGNIMLFCQRPFANSHEMNKYMTDQWNSVVGEDDLVIHMGDFASPPDVSAGRFTSQLNGHIILIRGNHDKMMLFRGMEMATNCMVTQVGPYRCLCNHRPYYPEEMRNEAKDPFKDHDRSVNAENVDFVLSGHIHNNYIENAEGKKTGRLWTGKSLNLSVEIHSYKPVAEEDLVKMLNKRKTYIDNPNPANDVIPASHMPWYK